MQSLAALGAAYDAGAPWVFVDNLARHLCGDPLAPLDVEPPPGDLVTGLCLI